LVQSISHGRAALPNIETGPAAERPGMPLALGLRVTLIAAIFAATGLLEKQRPDESRLASNPYRAPKRNNPVAGGFSRSVWRIAA
jgi:hypothetical protein